MPQLTILTANVTLWVLWWLETPDYTDSVLVLKKQHYNVSNTIRQAQPYLHTVLSGLARLRILLSVRH